MDALVVEVLLSLPWVDTQNATMLPQVESMVRVGFSTQTDNVLSKVIRWITGSRVSHAWFLIEDSFFRVPMVMEATETGFRLIPYDNFKAEGNDIIVVLETVYSLDAGVQEATRWLGERYDFAGLFGAIFVLLGRWLRRKWRNPLASAKAMFCSEAVVRVLQSAQYPGASVFDPASTTPQDLLDFFARTGMVETKYARGLSFTRPS